MDNTFVKQTKLQLNYQDMLDALIAKTRETHVWRENANCSPMADVRDYRTVGFYVGRQCGKSDTLVEFATRHPYGDCLMICKDSGIQRILTARYNKLSGENKVLPHLNVTEVRKLIDDANWTEYDFTKIKYVLIDDTSFVLDSFGINLRNFNKWVGENFPRDTMVIKVG